MKIFIHQTAVVSACGNGIESILEAASRPESNLSDLPFEVSWIPHRHGFLVSSPNVVKAGFNRQVLKTSEKQARLAMYAAAQAFPERLRHPERSHRETGLFMAIPTIETHQMDAHRDVFAALEANENPDWTEELIRGTPPLTGLSMLNSTVCSHLATALGIEGPGGGFSQSADAGLQALIEGAQAIREDGCPDVLVGAVSEEVTPFLFLRGTCAGRSGDQLPRPGEGAVFTRLAPEPPSDGRAVYLAGYARGFYPDDAETGVPELIEAALSMAGLKADDLDWIIHGSSLVPERNAEDAFSLEPLTGNMGPAGALAATALAKDAICRKYLLSTDGTAVPRNISTVLVIDRGIFGQTACVILKEDRDA